MKKVIGISLADAGIWQLHIFFNSFQRDMIDQLEIPSIDGLHLYSRHP